MRRTAWVAILDDADEENSLTAIGAGASAILWEGMPMTAQTSPSLYERLGGVYSIATVIDDFIDRIMVDPRLNANPRVDEAHHRVSPAGFKYLVTEMVCWATGGPQKYTGRSMKESHQHLMIIAAE
jgi:hemoglobin